jgi:RNA polymerase sigma-70 factor (ECF subfamily)
MRTKSTRCSLMRHGAPTIAEAPALDDAVSRARLGDVDAFETVYRAHAPAVYALCRRMSGDDGEARELTQDVFVQAWQRLGSFRGQSTLATWLHRVAVNVVLGHFRRADRRVFNGLDEEGAPALECRSPSLDDQLDITTALGRLPAGARTVFVLHEMYGYSHEEIAQMTGVAPGTARAQLWRARRAMLEALDR